MSEEKQYAERDLMAMDIAGNHYCRHVDHMTREKLHSKSDIAAELGWRDMQIAELKAQRDALAAENAAMKELAKGYADLADSRLSDITANCESDCRRECYQECNKTPATDAFLNSVRAEGLKMAIDHMNNQTSDDCADVTVLPVIEMYNQLRAGKDGE